MPTPIMEGANKGDAHEDDDLAVLTAVRTMLQEHHVELLNRLNAQDTTLGKILEMWCPELNQVDRACPILVGEDGFDINACLDGGHERQVTEASSMIDDLDLALAMSSHAVSAHSSPFGTSSKRPGLFRSNSEEERMLKAAAIEREQSLEAGDDGVLVGRLSRRLTTEERYEALGWREKLKATVVGVNFEMFFAIMILTNAVFIGVEVENNVRNPGDPPIQFRIVGQLYNVIFVVELALRLVAWGTAFFCVEAWVWNLLDCFIVLSSLWETVVEVMYAVADQAEMDGSTDFSPLRVIRIVRITRLVRVTKIARILRFVKALRTLVTSIISTLKSLFWAVVLMILIMYAFSIVFTQAVANHMEENNEPEIVNSLKTHWMGLGGSILTLFMCISGGLSWIEAIQPLQEMGAFYVGMFLFYIAFAYFAVLNVVTGVFCQSAIESAQSDHDMRMSAIMANKDLHIQKVKSLFKDLDGDESGFISLVELEQNIDKPSVQAYFEAIELEVEDAWNFFKLLDTDGGAAIEIEEFLMGCLRLRGPAKALDLAKLQHDHGWMMKSLAEFEKYMESSLKKLEMHIRHIQDRPMLRRPKVAKTKPTLPKLQGDDLVPLVGHDETLEAEDPAILPQDLPKTESCNGSEALQSQDLPETERCICLETLQSQDLPDTESETAAVPAAQDQRILWTMT